MRWLFRPAVAFMGRLRYVQKFALVGLVLALPLGLVTKAYVEGQDHQIAVSAKEHDGIGYLAPLVQLTAKVVDARHAAVTGKGGPAGLGTEIAEVDRVDRRLGSRLDTRKRWAEARRLLARAARAAGPRQGYAAYNRAAAALLSLIVHVGDRSNLTLDPDLDSYYLMDALQFRLPLLLDTAGRAVDRAVLANRGLDPDLTGAFIEIGSGNGVIASTRAALASGIATSLGNTASASLTRLVPSSMAALDRATARLLERLTDAVKRRRLGQLEASAGEQVRTQAARFAALVAVELDWLLEARIERFSDRARQVEALAALAGLLAVYLFVGFYLAVATPVRRMVAALRAVGAGDLDQVVPVDTRDELSIIGRALNDTVALTKVATERLAHEATHDVLTGLASRKLVLDRLDQALARQERHAGLLAVLFVDLDRFKPINDSLGHDPGDEVLRTVAERLRGAVRPGDLVGRLAGDEFVVVCEDLTGTGEAVAVSDRLIELVSRPIVVEQRPGISREVEVGASVGIVVARPGRAATPDELLRDADLAMYRAKQRGRGCAEIFDDALRVAVQRRLQVQEELRQAVHHGQLRTFYQPIVAAGTGAPSGFEALVRWEHPTRGLLGPAEFIPAAEDSALIVPLGAWVLREACRQLAAWRDADPAFTRLDMSVNLSARQLSDPSLVPMVAEILDGSGLAPHLLWLEITESTILTDIEAAEQTLGALHGLGVRLAIDDFGTGYSSLAHLRRFPLEALKIDRSFVQGVSGDPDDQAIVALVANLAHALRLQVVAEGVETAEQLDELRRLGCDRLQGYYFHRPMPAEDATAYLARSAGHAAVPAAQQPAAGLR